MRKINEKIINAWLDGQRVNYPSINTDGIKLYSYWTPLAWYDEKGQVIVNLKHYSNTTSRQQSDLKQILHCRGIEYKEA